MGEATRPKKAGRRTQRALGGNAKAKQGPVAGALLLQRSQRRGQARARAAAARAAVSTQQQRRRQLQKRLRRRRVSAHTAQPGACKQLHTRLSRRHVLAKHERAPLLPNLAQLGASGARPAKQRRHARVVAAATGVHGSGTGQQEGDARSCARR